MNLRRSITSTLSTPSQRIGPAFPALGILWAFPVYQMRTLFVALIMLGAATGYASELFGPVLGFTSAERGVY
jgi:hypothetical protein